MFGFMSWPALALSSVYLYLSSLYNESPGIDTCFGLDGTFGRQLSFMEWGFGQSSHIIKNSTATKATCL